MTSTKSRCRFARTLPIRGTIPTRSRSLRTTGRSYLRATIRPRRSLPLRPLTPSLSISRESSRLFCFLLTLLSVCASTCASVLRHLWYKNMKFSTHSLLILFRSILRPPQADRLDNSTALSLPGRPFLISTRFGLSPAYPTPAYTPLEIRPSRSTPMNTKTTNWRTTVFANATSLLFAAVFFRACGIDASSASVYSTPAHWAASRDPVANANNYQRGPGHNRPTPIAGGLAQPDAITAVTYAFTSTTGIPLEDMSSGTTTMVAPNQQAVASPLFDIGFDFWFDGVRQTRFSANAAGLMKLGTTVVTRLNGMTLLQL